MDIFDELIRKGRQTEVGEKLYQIVSEFAEDKGTIAMALNQMETDEKKQKLIDYIKKYNINTDEDVEALRDCIDEGREPELIEE